jgi:hypothetical protein
MATANRTGPRSLRTYSVLCGLTPLVPLPFVDDLVRSYFRRRLVRELAAARGATLAAAEVAILADERSGCLTGCLLSPFVYVLKKLFRKIFYFLEWKRAVDLASETYHFGLLVDHALDRGWLAPAGPHDGTRLRAAIDAVLARRGTSPVEGAVRETFVRSRNSLKSAAGALRGALGSLRRRTPKEQVERAVDSMAASSVEGVAGELESALEKLPPGYLDGFRRLLDEELSSKEG